ncbi:extracellular solute-binding protein [Mesorhizobium abyssinicae]|uniref:ABC transporter substrate-binding protein n=1 Tax=Mesorhizobium abyssinicae TaxID=1209958 RepID=UPI002A23C189|nr:extracellular solute-binding protein [Mesorhizobium abyssinicae]MDX8433284.1 extracellular solute-binding protein [Mesorhizobium abyssinicae]
MIPKNVGLASAFFAAGISAATAVAAQSEIQVSVVGEPGETVVYEQLAASYNAEHPETKFVITKNSSDLFNPALIPSLSSGEGPELFVYGTGPGQPAAIIDGGLVADLTGYYKQYGWDKFIPQSVVDVTSSKGKLWAVGNEVETTGMFYNKAIFDKLGLKVPSTWEDFRALIKTLKQAGYDTPIGLGGADKWPISHWQSMLFGRYASPAGLQKVMFGDGAWNATEFVKAAARLQEMAQQGYFGPNPVADGYAEIMEKFWAGKIPMTFTGSFAIQTGVATAGARIDDFGAFQVPPFEATQKVYPTEGIGSGWYISASSSHKDEIAAFLNYLLFTPTSRVTLLNAGTTPVGPLSDVLPKANLPKLTQAMAALNDRDRSNGTIYAYLDTVTPKNITTLTYDGLQALVLGQTTPQQFDDEIEAAWQTDKADGSILKPGGLKP